MTSKKPDTLRVKDAIGGVGGRPLIVEGTSVELIHELMMSDWPQRVEDKARYMSRVARCCDGWLGTKEAIRVHSGARAFINDLIRSGFLTLLSVNGVLTPAGQAERLMTKYHADLKVKLATDPDMEPEDESDFAG